ncbi:surface polysaccharide O-acyltransferase-like enzyme [Pseudomonas sp. TE12234]
MHIETIWIVFAAVLLLIELWAINRVRKAEGKSSTKGVWMVVIVFVPLFGLIAWALAGPKRVAQNPHSSQA